MAPGEPISNLRLPLPTGLVDNHQVQYTKADAGTLVGSAISGNPESVAAATALSTFKGVMGMAASTLNLASLTNPMLAGFARGVAQGENPLVAIQAMSGMSPNPFTTILLKGPEYKVHNFTWRLSPNTESESKQIKGIITQLNNSMAPSYAMNGVAFYGFPNVFNIKYVPNEHMLYRFKPAVLQQLQVNYSPSGNPAFYKQTAAPDAVEITAQFLELEYWINGQFA